MTSKLYKLRRVFKLLFVLPLMPLLYFTAMHYLSPSFKELHDFNSDGDDSDSSSIKYYLS